MQTIRPDAAKQAEAAAWLARLRWEGRTADDEASFRAWLAEDPSHQQAFDLINTAWEIAGGGYAASSVPGVRRKRRNRVRPVLGAGLAAAAAAAALAVFMFRPAAVETYETQRGMQQKVALADGSSILLDTSTMVRTSLDSRERRIELVRGRAHFEVAKDENRPFVVEMGTRRVVAVGTAFDVSREANLTSVLLTHGKVLLEDARHPRLMSPGDRVAFNGDKVTADRPDLDKLTAWQSGRAVFQDQPLASVVTELNRYTRRPLVIADAEVGAMRISGSYKTGDSEAFAVSISTLLPLDVQTQADRILLARRKD